MPPDPIASGTLDKTPLPHLLVYLEQHQLSGTLAVWPDEEQETDARSQDRILFLKGRPVAGRLVEPAASLREGLLRLFTRVRAPYAFYDTNLLGDDRVSGRVDPVALMAEALRSHAREDVVEAVLSHLGDSKLRLQPGVDLKRYAFVQDERSLIELLQAEPADVAALVKGCGLSAARGRRLVYLLAITKAVAPYDEPEARPSGESSPVDEARAVAGSSPLTESPVPDGAVRAPAETAAGAEAGPSRTSSPGEPSIPPPSARAGTPLHGRLDRLAAVPAPPPGLAPELEARWQRVATRVRLIENQNYFEMLGVQREVKSIDVKTKFFQLAKEWHPDRLPKELSPLRAHCEIVFGYMSEAYTTLENDEGRKEYQQTLREGGGTPASDQFVQRVLDAAMEFERVLVLTRQNRYDDALELLERILAVSHDDPDHHAHHAWLLMKKFAEDDAPFDRMLAAADRALKLRDEHEKANVYKAQILRRMGRPREALALFRKVAEKYPRNVDAAREVRIASLRTEGGRQKGEKSATGLLGKLFGKK